MGEREGEREGERVGEREGEREREGGREGGRRREVRDMAQLLDYLKVQSSVSSKVSFVSC